MSFKLGASSTYFRIGSAAALLKYAESEEPVAMDLVGTAHFLNAPMQVTSASSIDIEVSAEQFNPSDSLDSLILEKVDGDDGTETVISSQSMTRGTAHVFPGNAGKTNQVSPWHATVSLTNGENIFRVQYTGGDGVTTVSQYHHVFRKSSLLETTVSTKADLIKALGRSMRNEIDTYDNSNHNAGTETTWRWDVIKVSSDLSFEYGEWASTNAGIVPGGIIPSPFVTQRHYPVVIEPTSSGSLTFQLNYSEVWKDNGRDTLTQAKPGNFAGESLKTYMVHFKGCTFGVPQQAMSSGISGSSSLVSGDKQQVLTFEDCTFHDRFMRSVDSTLPTTPAGGDLNPYPSTIFADYPSHDDWAPGTASRESIATVSISGDTATIDCTGLEYVYSKATAPGIETITVKDLGSSSYEVQITFAQQALADIFVGMSNWLQAHSYLNSGLEMDVLSADGSGWTRSIMAAGSPEEQNEFRLEIQSNTSSVITLSGTNANSFGAAIFSVGDGNTTTLNIATRSSNVKSTVVYTSNQSTVNLPHQRVSYIGCNFNGLHLQAGISTSAERFVDCYFKHLRGDLGHSAMCVFNVSLESGSPLVGGDYFDQTHSDVLQSYGEQAERIAGSIFQNIYQGDSGEGFGADKTIPIFFDRTPMFENNTEYRHRGWIMDNWEMDSTAYVFDAVDASVSPNVGNSQLAARMQNIRFSNCSFLGSPFLARFDFEDIDKERGLDLASDASTYFHNNEFYTISWAAKDGADSPPDNTPLAYGATNSEPPSGSETNIGNTLSDVSEVGTTRIGSTWTGTNTVQPAPTGP